MSSKPSILVILDRPGGPQFALDRARELAKNSSAHLHLASFCWLAMVDDDRVFDTHQRLALQKGAITERQRWLDGLILDAGLRAADVSTEVVWTRDIADWVNGWTEGRAVDFVVKTVHRGTASILHTPLDWQLLRSCKVPLLLAVQAPKAGPVLATVDLGHADETHQLMNHRVLETAQQMAERLGAALHGMHVVETTGFPDSLDGYEVDVLAADAELRSRELLEALLKPYGMDAGSVHLQVGHVGTVVAELARDLDASMLVVGTGARGRIGSMLVGNSAERILAEAPCDVLAVHV